MRIVGGLHLAWLGGHALWDAFAKPRLAAKAAAGEPAILSAGKAAPGSAASIPPWRAFRTALLLSLTNPKAILFYLAFFVQFIDEAYPHPWVPYLILASILQFWSVSILSFLVTAGAGALRRIARHPWAVKLGTLCLGTPPRSSSSAPEQPAAAREKASLNPFPIVRFKRRPAGAILSRPRPPFARRALTLPFILPIPSCSSSSAFSVPGSTPSAP